MGVEKSLISRMFSNQNGKVKGEDVAELMLERVSCLLIGMSTDGSDSSFRRSIED